MDDDRSDITSRLEATYGDGANNVLSRNELEQVIIKGKKVPKNQEKKPPDVKAFLKRMSSTYMPPH